MDEETRALIIELRRYVMQHGLLLGECVAWTALKERYGVKNTSYATVADDEAWAQSWRDDHPTRNAVRWPPVPVPEPPLPRGPGWKGGA